MKTTTVITIRILYIIIALLLLSVILNAQIKINERVTISPSPVPLFKAASGGDFVIEFQYSGTLDPNRNTNPWLDIQAHSYEPCEGRYERTAPLMTGAYQTMIRFTAITNGTVTYSYKANGQDLKSGTYTVDLAPCTVQYLDGFGFSESFKFEHDSVVNDYWENVSVYGDGAICQTNVQWSPSFFTTWTIVQGSQWGQLNDENGNPVGATYTARVADIAGLTFKFAPNVPDTVFCIIKATSNGLVRYKKIYPSNYKQKELDHFKVTIVPDTAATADTVAFTEGAKLIIQAKDKDDKDFFLDANTLLKISLLTNDEFGTFINANIDTLKTTPVQLTDVLYSNAQAGKIKFAAVKKNPDSLVTCKIHVEKQSDPTKYGEKDAVVVEQTLKIVMVTPYEVVPRNLQGLRNPLNPIDENKKRITIQLTRNSVGVANHPFLLTTDYLDGTGGHDHITPRRTENRENYGYFILRRNNTAYDRPYNGQTQLDGREIFDYISSFFGDSLRINVRSTDPKKETFFKDSVIIVEKAGGLNSLGEGVNYILVGGTCNHHGPSDQGIPQNCQTPNNNHYGTSTLIQIVQAVADSFATTYNGYRLRINDMSLRFGGKFEIDGSWNQNADHQKHRMGINADVNLDAYKDGVNINLNLKQKRKLWILIRNIAGRNPGDETNRNHYHIQ